MSLKVLGRRTQTKAANPTIYKTSFRSIDEYGIQQGHVNTSHVKTHPIAKCLSSFSIFQHFPQVPSQHCYFISFISFHKPFIFAFAAVPQVAVLLELFSGIEIDVVKDFFSSPMAQFSKIF